MMRIFRVMSLVLAVSVLAAIVLPGVVGAVHGRGEASIENLVYTQFSENTYFGLHGAYQFSAAGQGTIRSATLPEIDGAVVGISHVFRLMPDSATSVRGSTQGRIDVGGMSSGFAGSISGSFMPIPSGYEANMIVSATTTSGDKLTLNLTITSDANAQLEQMYGSGTLEATH